MKIRTAVLLVPLLLALCAGTAAAKTAPPHAGLDPRFGHGGTIAVPVTQDSEQQGMQIAVAPSGKSYVLDGSMLSAFGANGLPDPGFATHGHTNVAATAGETATVSGLAVDAKGRILVAGSVDPTPGVESRLVPPGTPFVYLPKPSNAFVVRYLPDGERDPTFGVGGQLEVTLTPPARPATAYTTAHLEQPSVWVDRLAVVGSKQPVIGGAYSYYADGCYTGSIANYGFVAPVGSTGSATENVALTAANEISGNRVVAMNPLPGGNLAAFSDERGGCSHGGGANPAKLATFDYGSTPAPALDPSRPPWSIRSVAVDDRGRMLGLEIYEEDDYTGGALPPLKLLRLSPDGDLDPSFGSNGGVPLKKFYGESLGAVVADAKNRPVIAGGDKKFRVLRLGTKGKIDLSFAKHGWLEVGFGAKSTSSPYAEAVDAKGRVIVAGWVQSPTLKGGEGIGLIRILPGG